MEPITAKLWLSKEGNAWRVSRFVQEERVGRIRPEAVMCGREYGRLPNIMEG